MRIYTKEQKQPLRWLVAVVVFLLAMGVTFSDLHGFNVPSGKSGSGTNSGAGSPTKPYVYDNTGNDDGSYDNQDTDPNYQNPPDDDDNPETVPEPGTLLLMSMGLSAAYLISRRKSQ